MLNIQKSCMTFTMKTDKVGKLRANFQNKKEYFIHIRKLKQALNHELVLKKVHRIIKFNQNDWLKSCIGMNTELRKKAKNDFEKDVFKLMNNLVFGKTMENVRKHEDIKLVKTEARGKYLVSDPNHETNFFFR